MRFISYEVEKRRDEAAASAGLGFRILREDAKLFMRYEGGLNMIKVYKNY